MSDDTLSVSSVKFSRLVHHIKEIRALAVVVMEELDELVDDLNIKDRQRDEVGSRTHDNNGSVGNDGQ